MAASNVGKRISRNRTRGRRSLPRTSGMRARTCAGMPLIGYIQADAGAPSAPATLPRPPMLIRAKAPLRISFAGGGTDVPPFPEREGGLVLNATIDRYAFGLLRPRRDRQVRIESADFWLSVNYQVDEPPIFDGRLDLVKAAIRRLGD